MARNLHTGPALIDTRLGWLAVSWSSVGVQRVAFGHSNPRAAVGALDAWEADAVAPPPGSQRLLRKLQRSLEGKAVDLSKVVLDLRDATEFQAEVIRRCREIPRGSVWTYGQLAAAAGSPRAARAVGNIMASNRFPLVVPCHRVVGACGWGGYSASLGLKTKRRLLALEGVEDRSAALAPR